MITVKTELYQGAHGRSPRGFGNWAFKIGQSTVSFYARYAEAKKKAQKLAKLADVTTITLLT